MKISPSRDALSPCEPPFFPIYLNVTHSLLLQSCMISNCPECSFSYLISNSSSIIAFTLTFYLLSFSSVVAVTLLCSAAVLPCLMTPSLIRKAQTFGFPDRKSEIRPKTQIASDSIYFSPKDF